jgi:hypothetical protein
MVMAGGGATTGSLPPAKALQAKDDKTNKLIMNQKDRSRSIRLSLKSADVNSVNSGEYSGFGRICVLRFNVFFSLVKLRCEVSGVTVN